MLRILSYLCTACTSAPLSFLVLFARLIYVQLNQHTPFSSKLWKAHSKRRYVSAHPHKVCCLHGIQQADSQVFSFVVHGNHVKGYCFWHSEDNGYDPDECYLDSHPFWKTYSFDPAPRGHSTIPERPNNMRLVYRLELGKELILESSCVDSGWGICSFFWWTVSGTWWCIHDVRSTTLVWLDLSRILSRICHFGLTSRPQLWSWRGYKITYCQCNTCGLNIRL